ncbi:MAG: DUF4838 domain-containing protein, partial [Candidatus Odinarchaeota archaeon]
MTRIDLFEQDKEELISLLRETDFSLASEVTAILTALVELLTSYPEEVRTFALYEMQDFLVEKAENYYNSFKNNSSPVSIEKSQVYFYHFCSISLLIGSYTFLFPYNLIALANYINFIPLLCTEVRKIGTEAGQVTLEDFLTAYYDLLKKSRVKLYKRDVELVKELANFDFSRKNWHVTFSKYERNKKFRDDIVGWSKICNRLYIWDYTTNFRHYILPHPNLRVLGPNVKFFVDHNVKGIFEQGAYTSN